MNEDRLALGALVAFVCGWLTAQIAKAIIDAVKAKKFVFKDFLESLTRSGGMPSGHSGSFVGLTTYLGLVEGFGSYWFVFSLCVTGIIIYDATHVRYAVGKHGEVINAMLVENGHKDKKLKIIEGHTVAQAIVGSLIGVASGVIMAAIFKGL